MTRTISLALAVICAAVALNYLTTFGVAVRSVFERVIAALGGAV